MANPHEFRGFENDISHWKIGMNKIETLAGKNETTQAAPCSAEKLWDLGCTTTYEFQMGATHANTVIKSLAEATSFANERLSLALTMRASMRTSPFLRCARNAVFKKALVEMAYCAVVTNDGILSLDDWTNDQVFQPAFASISNDLWSEFAIAADETQSRQAFDAAIESALEAIALAMASAEGGAERCVAGILRRYSTPSINTFFLPLE